MQKAFFTILFLVLTVFSFAQKKKTIKKYNIRSIITTEAVGTKTITDRKESYNASGQLAEEINYDKDGKFKSHTKYKYNPDGDVTEEAQYNEAGALIEKRVTRYDIAGEKTEELSSDKNGKQVKKVTYAHNAKGLKTEKKIFDANNVLISTKKFTYK